MSDWPKKDPITGRMICESCFNGTHYHKLIAVRKDFHGKSYSVYRPMPSIAGAEHACNGECDCIHLSEEHWAALKRKTSRDNRKARKDLMSSELESSPLRAVNENFKSKKRFVGA